MTVVSTAAVNVVAKAGPRWTSHADVTSNPLFEPWASHTCTYAVIAHPARPASAERALHRTVTDPVLDPAVTHPQEHATYYYAAKQVRCFDCKAQLAAEHDCMDFAQSYESDGALGHGFDCSQCGAFIQAG